MVDGTTERPIPWQNRLPKVYVRNENDIPSEQEGIIEVSVNHLSERFGGYSGRINPE